MKMFAIVIKREQKQQQGGAESGDSHHYEPPLSRFRSVLSYIVIVKKEIAALMLY